MALLILKNKGVGIGECCTCNIVKFWIQRDFIPHARLNDRACTAILFPKACRSWGGASQPWVLCIVHRVYALSCLYEDTHGRNFCSYPCAAAHLSWSCFSCASAYLRRDRIYSSVDWGERGFHIYIFSLFHCNRCRRGTKVFWAKLIV